VNNWILNQWMTESRSCNAIVLFVDNC